MKSSTPALNTLSKTALHPVMMIAAVAVVLFCGVGSAGLMGWLPSSVAGGVPSAALAGERSTGDAELATAQATPRQPAPVSVERAAPPCTSCGVVESVDQVQQRAQGSGAGAAGGALLGGLLGNQVGSGHGRQLATVAGAIGGAVAGNQIEGTMRATHSYTTVVRMNDGNSRSFQQSSAPNWRAGDAVKVVKGQLHSA